MKSYTNQKMPVIASLREWYFQYKALNRVKKNVSVVVADMLSDYEDIEGYCGGDLSGMSILEIGHGQLPLQLAYFSCRSSKAVGIDLDVVPQSFCIQSYLKVYRTNGLRRCLKTVAREVLGFNSAYRKEFCKQMKLDVFPKLDMRYGDVSHVIDLPDDSVDLVFSTDVFEHLADPGQALVEIKRVCKPGGLVITRTLHGNHYNSLHDIDVLHGVKKGRWAHLRPAISAEVVQGAYVNGITIEEWKVIFTNNFTNSATKNIPVEKNILQKLISELGEARGEIELENISDEELLTDHLLIVSRNDPPQNFDNS